MYLNSLFKIVIHCPIKSFFVFCVTWTIETSFIYADVPCKLSFSIDDISFTKEGSYDVLYFKGLQFINKPGMPKLPVKQVYILIPANESAKEVEINFQNFEILQGKYYIKPAQPEVPIKYIEVSGNKFFNPDSIIYNVPEFYPKGIIEITGESYLAGYHIVSLLVYPMQYNPVKRTVKFYTTIEFSIKTKFNKDSSVKAKRLKESTKKMYQNILEGLIQNPEDINKNGPNVINDMGDFENKIQQKIVSKTKTIENSLATSKMQITEFPSIESTPIDYVIITSDELVNQFTRLTEWKTKKGMPAIIKTVSWIKTNYPGCDPQEQIRNFIKDAFEKWGTIYFVLAGDNNIIPVRYAWIGPFDEEYVPKGEFIPADMYYSCLDGNWNKDGDATFGEGTYNRANDGSIASGVNVDDIDLEPDVFVARIPVENSTEAQIYLDNYFDYTKAVNITYQNKALMFSANSDHIYSSQMDVVASQFPLTINITKLYENTGHIKNDVLNAFNQDFNIICGYGHGGQYLFEACLGMITNADIDAFVNSPKYNIVYLNHCMTNAYDYDCIGEHFLSNPNGGSIAYIGNTRFGWTGDPSTWNKEFIYQIYQKHKYGISNAFNSAKYAQVSSSNQDNTIRWEQFSLNISADPDLDVWTAIPTEDLTVSHPMSIENGENNFTVSISNNILIGQEVLICLQKGNEDYAVKSIISDGEPIVANFLFTPDTPGELTVTVTSHNFIPYEATVPVYQNGAAHLYMESYTIDDDQVGESTGNGDGIIDAGETIELPITLRNSGDYFSSVFGITATLEAFERGTPDPQSVPHPYITITDGGSSFGYEIPGQSSASSDNDFGFSVATNCPDKSKEVVEFRLTIVDETDQTWTETFFLQIGKPDVQHTHHTVNGTLQAYATVGLSVQLSNLGGSVAKGITATLAPATGSSVVSVTGSPQTFGDINPNSTSTSNYSFTLSSDYTYGNEQLLTFLLTIQDAYGKVWTHSFDLKKPGVASDLQFTGYETAIDLNWSKPGDSDLKGYNIYRCTSENGTYEKVNNLLSEGTSYYKDPELQKETIYYYKISTVDASANESDLIGPLKAWTTIKYLSGWPILPNNADHTNFYSSPKMVDVDGDGDMEIFAANSYESGTIYAWDHTGAELFEIDGNPTSISGLASVPGANFWCTPAITDLDGDGIYELLIATRREAYGSQNFLYCWKISDASNPDLYWPLNQINIGSPALGSPVVGDIDNNGHPEIIIITQDGNIHVYQYDGNPYQTLDPWKTTGNATAYSTPALADVDKDGFLDIIVSGGDGKIHVWSHDGSNMLEISTGFVNLSASPVIADIDGDGDYEMIIVAYTIGSDCKVFVKDKYGNDKSGWTGGKSISLPGGVVSSSPAIGNLDSDPQLEIVFATGSQVLAWNHDGTTLNNGWPKTKTIYESSPMIADIDDIPGPEIIIGSADKNLYAWHTNGDEVNGWPLRTGDIFLSSPAIGDVDGDGKNEVVVASYDKLVHIWDTKGTTNKDWPMFHFDAQNTGCYSNIVSGTLTQNTTWMGKVSVVGNLTVPSDLTLTISSGTTVSFEKGSSLLVNGTLTANDAPSVNKVYFDFKQIDWTTQNGLKVLAGGLANITNVVIKNAKYGVYNYEGITNITNSEILNCFYGVYLYRNNYASQQSQIINNIIYNNCPGIHMYSSSPDIRDNVIYDNYYGVYCWSYSSPYLGDYELTGDNNIYDNYIGFYAVDHSNPFLGRSTCEFYAGYNKIENSQSYNIYAHGNCEIYAENNWWGADPPNTNKILAASYSTIYYDPWLQTPPFGQSKGLSSSPEEVAYNNNFPRDEKEGTNLKNSTQNADNGTLTGYSSQWSINWKLLYARSLIGIKKYKAAQSVCKEIILNHPDSTLSSYALDLLWQASRQYDKDPLKNFLEYLSNKNEKKKILVSAELILAGYDKKNKELRFDKILNKYKDDPIIEYVLLNKFLYYYHELNDEVNARSILAQIDKQYPDSRSAIAAHDLIGDNKNKAKKSGNAFAVTEKSDENDAPNNYELLGNYPNPFNPSTTINYALPVQSNVEINIFDIMGRLIRTFELNGQSAGYQNVLWNGRNENNEQVASGIYLYRFKAVATDGKVFEKTSKLLMLK